MNILLSIIIYSCASHLSLAAIENDSTAIQDQKFRMIKAAAIFYAQDDSLHPGKAAPDCSNAKNISDLIECTKDLQGVSKKIYAFDTMHVYDRTGLGELKNEIVKQVSMKSYRVSMSGYNDFTSKLTDLAGSVAVNREIVPAHLPETSAPAAGMESSQVDIQTSGGFNTWHIVSIGISALAILIAGLSFKKSNKEQERPAGTKKSYQVKEPVSKEHNSVVYEQLKNKQSDLEQQLTRLNARFDQLFSNTGINTPPTDTPVTTAASTATIKYAKTPDGKAFNADMLSDRQDDKKIYEITITSPGKGTFAVTSNKEAQLFALEDPNNYLRDACKYQSQATRNSTIITVTPGTVELNGNKWSILTMAEIGFL